MIKRNRLKLLLSGFLLLPGMIFAQQLPYRQSSPSDIGKGGGFDWDA